jgi:hypothetical protein
MFEFAHVAVIYGIQAKVHRQPPFPPAGKMEISVATVQPSTFNRVVPTADEGASAFNEGVSAFDEAVATMVEAAATGVEAASTGDK